MPRHASDRSARGLRARRRRDVAPIAAAALVVVAALVGCGADAPRTNSAYCTAVQDQLALIVTPTLAAPTDIATALDAFEAVAASAPAAVEPEWQEVVAVMRAASTVDRADQVAMEAFVETALAAQPSITRVQQFTQQICAIDIGTPPTPTNPALVTVPDTATGDDTGGG